MLRTTESRPTPYHRLLSGFLLLALMLVVGCKNQTGKPNVLILFTDDQRYTSVGSLGIENVSTPAMEASGKAENTIIVFSGDNGLAVGQHGLLGKQSVYEHSVKVPLVFKGPGIPKNQKTEAFAYLHDVFPTLCGLIGLDIPESTQTKDLSPVLLGEEEGVRASMLYVYNSWPGDKKPDQRGAHRAVRKGDYKLIVSSKDGVLTHQLFNVKKDPWELKNLSVEEALQKTKADLLIELKSLIKKAGDPADLEKDMFGLFSAVEQK